MPPDSENPSNPGTVSLTGSPLRRRGPGRFRPKKFGTGNDVHAHGKLPGKRYLRKTERFNGDFNLQNNSLIKSAKIAPPAPCFKNFRLPEARYERKIYPDHGGSKPGDPVFPENAPYGQPELHSVRITGARYGGYGFSPRHSPT